MRNTLDDLVLRKSVPVIGVCVGMQMLAHSSEEGDLPGLGWIDAEVKSFKTWQAARDLPVPHMGWNDVHPQTVEPLFEGLRDGARFYFLHSYYFNCRRRENVLATCNYGSNFDCAVRSSHIYGVQFHPEKSHHFGSQLLKNFAAI
ncbi:glutamine amidotransferase [Bradyrhizobium centrosematis]|nr:glutamine amidotransferase [Bradyrhizobium centrosematis]MCS3773971.1 glutamine amidotransferase [Bradyrhizobium centrosematis]